MFGLEISLIEIIVFGLICLRLKISCVRFLIEQILWCGGGEISVMFGIEQCSLVMYGVILLFGSWLFLFGFVFWVILIWMMLVLIRQVGVMLKWLEVICLMCDILLVLQCVGFLLFLLELEKLLMLFIVFVSDLCVFGFRVLIDIVVVLKCLNSFFVGFILLMLIVFLSGLSVSRLCSVVVGCLLINFVYC